MKNLEYFPNYFPNITRVILFLLFIIVFYCFLLFFIIYYYFVLFIIIFPTLFNISNLRYNILKPIYQTINKSNQKMYHNQPLIYRYMINHHQHDHHQPPTGHNLNKIISPYHYIIISIHLYHINTTPSS